MHLPWCLTPFITSLYRVNICLLFVDLKRPPLTAVPENAKCALNKFPLVFIAVVAFKDTVYNETHFKYCQGTDVYQ